MELSSGEERKCCPNCSEYDSIVFDETQASSICEVCGAVIEESSLKSDLSRYKETGTRFVSNFSTAYSYSSRTRSRQQTYNLVPKSRKGPKQVYAKISSLCQLFNLPKGYSDEVKLLVGRCMQGTWYEGRKGDHIIGSCIYMVSRLHEKPIHLVEVANALQCSPFKLGKMFKTFQRELGINLKEVDPSLFVERYARQLPLDSVDVQKVCMLAKCILRCASSHLYTIGRSPSSIAAAALFLAAEHFKLPVQLSAIVQLAYTSENTTKIRTHEFKRLFLLLAQKLPWGEAVTKLNVAAHIPMILQMWDLEDMVSKGRDRIKKSGEGGSNHKDNSTELLPLSLRKVESSRIQRKEKIQRAQARVLALIQGDKSEVPEPLDEEDLRLQRLLLIGQTPEQLLH